MGKHRHTISEGIFLSTKKFGESPRLAKRQKKRRKRKGFKKKVNLYLSPLQFDAKIF